MKGDSDQKERCNKKAEWKFGFFEDCQSDTTSKKAKKRSLYKQNIFCSSKLFFLVKRLFLIRDVCYDKSSYQKRVAGKHFTLRGRRSYELL